MTQASWFWDYMVLAQETFEGGKTVSLSFFQRGLVHPTKAAITIDGLSLTTSDAGMRSPEQKHLVQILRFVL